MKSNKKGNRIELEFCKLLESFGYVIDRAERSVRVIPVKFSKPCPVCHKMKTWMISKKHDTFGCFDVIAKHKEHREFTLYFQIAANRWKYGEDKLAMEVFPASPTDKIFMVRKDDRKPWRFRELIDFGFMTEWVDYEYDKFNIDYLSFQNKENNKNA